MVCLGFKTWTKGLKVQTNPLSYAGPLSSIFLSFNSWDVRLTSFSNLANLLMD